MRSVVYHSETPGMKYLILHCMHKDQLEKRQKPTIGCPSIGDPGWCFKQYGRWCTKGKGIYGVDGHHITRTHTPHAKTPLGKLCIYQRTRGKAPTIYSSNYLSTAVQPTVNFLSSVHHVRVKEIVGVHQSELFLRHWSSSLHLELEVVAVQVALVVLSVCPLRHVQERMTTGFG